MNTSTLLDLLSHTALKGAAVLLAALLLGLALSRMAAARRYALWITAIATLALLPLAMWVLPAWHVLPQTSAARDWPMMELRPVGESAELFPLPEDFDFTMTASQPALPLPAQITEQPSFSWDISWQDVVAALPVAWMLIAGLLLLRLAHSAWRLHRLEATLRPGECAMLEQTARSLGLKRIPRLLIGPHDSVPMVWGVLKARLLLPEGFEAWSEEKQRGVLLHELAHLKRGDPFALWVAQWVKVLHWFNPLVWLTLRQLRADQERACDDAVLRQGVRASDYAQSLLDLSRHNRLAPGLSLCALTITRYAPVEARVKAILDPQRRREGLTLRWLAGLAGCALLISLPVAMLHAIEGPALRGRILDRNGVVLAESTKEKVRVYPLKTLAAHVIGYTGRMSRDDDTPTGREASELQQDAALRQGKDVSLTLDMRVQALTTRAMTEGGLARGAAVVLDPRTGEILAAVSLPAYDPNCFAPRVSAANYQAYSTDKNLPLFDRCLRKMSPPANAFVPLTALAGIMAGAGDRTFECKPSTTSYQSKFECLNVRQGRAAHGIIGMESAVQHSCRHYWCQLGMAAGLDAFGKVGTWIGFGEAYGVMEGESPGILPTQQWWEKHRKGIAAWNEGNSASLAEGLGLVLVTPLQMSVLAATVANNGRVPQPALFHQSTHSWRADLVKEGLSPVQIQKLREGMRLAVNGEGGVGQGARSEKAVIAGSTGVFQLTSRDAAGFEKKRTHEWFIGFAPFENPALAFAIFKEDGSSEGADTGPIVKRIVEETLALPADGSGAVLPVEDAIGQAHEKLLQTQARFDAQAAEITSEAGLILKQLGEGVELKKVTIAGGGLTLLGEAVDVPTALQVLNRLPQIGKQWVIEWNFPIPTPQQDGKRVAFRAEGVCTAAAEQEGHTQRKGKITSAMDADIILDPQLADRWRLLKKKGFLADLPASAVIPKPGTWMVGVAYPFQFTAPREEVQLWLAGSLGDAPRKYYEKEQPWPEKPGVFAYTYEGFGDCMIHIKTLDAETVEVRLWVQSRGPKPILIAPDEAAPPTPKTAAPKELSGVVSTDTQPVDDGGQLKFEFDAEEISRQIRLLAKKTGISLREVKNGGGKLSFIGLADDLDGARMFGDLLTQSGRQSGIAWHVTAPRKVQDRPVTMFMAVGFYQTASITAALSSPPNTSVSAVGGVVSPLSNWQTLQKFGKLADLPADYAPERITPAENLGGPLPSVMYAFTASRKAVHAWLSASLPAKRLAAHADKLRELAEAESFQHDFWGPDLCRVRVVCAENKARVLISRMTRIFEIAPDESQKPRPAGKLAPEYRQDGLTAAESAVPTLESSAPQRESTNLPEEALKRRAVSLPPVRLQEIPSPTRVKPQPMPLRHLAGALSAESEKALLRSSRMNNRMQQSLIVRSSE